jgi:hypothetical protein
MLSLHFAMSLRHVYATKVELSIKAMRIMLTKQLIKYAINYKIYKNSATLYKKKNSGTLQTRHL